MLIQIQTKTVEERITAFYLTHSNWFSNPNLNVNTLSSVMHEKLLIQNDLFG